jgi:hypothetical protein
MKKTGRRVRRTLWAYDYAIVPPQEEEQLDRLRRILEVAHTAARRAARTWTGRVVREQQVTHILVVSDSPDQDRGVNRRLEGLLNQANASFSLTAPMAVAAAVAPLPHA